MWNSQLSTPLLTQLQDQDKVDIMKTKRKPGAGALLQA